MTERYSLFPDFDRKSLTEALGGELRPVHDVAHGDGEAVGVAGKAELEIYPRAGVARVTTEHARVEVFRVPGMTTDDEAGRVHFQRGEEDDRVRLLVRSDGNVSFYPVLRATETRTAAETPRDAPVSHQTPETASQSVTEPTDTAAPPAQESEEHVIVTLTGRLGRDPWFNRDGDELRAGFPLAVNHADATTWHNVVAHGEAAEEVDAGRNAGYIRKGREVDVAGRHSEPTGKGKPPFVATAVTRPARRRQSSPGRTD